MSYQRVRKHRKKKGWTQQELADRAGVSKQSISAYERGSRAGTVPLLRKIATAFEVPLAELLSQEEGLELTAEQLLDLLQERAHYDLNESTRKEFDTLLDLARLTYARGRADEAE